MVARFCVMAHPSLVFGCVSVSFAVPDYFMAMEEPFLQTVRGFGLLPGFSQKQAESFLLSYYKMFRNDYIQLQYMSSACK